MVDVMRLQAALQNGPLARQKPIQQALLVIYQPESLHSRHLLKRQVSVPLLARIGRTRHKLLCEVPINCGLCKLRSRKMRAL